ncbi:phage head closure protein [Xanthobacter sp.]|uniref:phage head closure protein n=1 Tax=Xanthobacter sp. TaxID=35809 RepID=UPI0025D36A66|nr:phage head closure protein [Xanthobacter sp.]
MKAGQMDRRITIERGTEARDADGVLTTTWAPVATLWASLIQSSTSEFLQGSGLQGDTATIFRIRWLAGVTLLDRIRFDGVGYDIKEIKELGRRRGLEIRTIARGVD